MKKYLTIKEKAQLAREGKDIPVCVYTDEKAEKKKKEKLFKRFAKNI